jgi:hypothetical protein
MPFSPERRRTQSSTAFGIILDSPPSPMRSAYIANFKNAVDNHIYTGFVLDDTEDSYNNNAGWLPAGFLQQYPVRLLAASSSSSDWHCQSARGEMDLPSLLRTRPRHRQFHHSNLRRRLRQLPQRTIAKTKIAVGRQVSYVIGNKSIDRTMGALRLVPLTRASGGMSLSCDRRSCRSWRPQS